MLLIEMGDTIWIKINNAHLGICLVSSCLFCSCNSSPISLSAMSSFFVVELLCVIYICRYMIKGKFDCSSTHASLNWGECCIGSSQSVPLVLQVYWSSLADRAFSACATSRAFITQNKQLQRYCSCHSFNHSRLDFEDWSMIVFFISQWR